MSRCEPALIRVGASSSPASKKRKSIRSARPSDVTLTRHDEKIVRLLWVAVVASKAHVDVPAGITGVVGLKETAPERFQALAAESSAPRRFS